MCVHVYVVFGEDWAEAYVRDGSKYVAREISYAANAERYSLFFRVYTVVYSTAITQ